MTHFYEGGHALPLAQRQGYFNNPLGKAICLSIYRQRLAWLLGFTFCLQFSCLFQKPCASGATGFGSRLLAVLTHAIHFLRTVYTHERHMNDTTKRVKSKEKAVLKLSLTKDNVSSFNTLLIHCYYLAHTWLILRPYTKDTDVMARWRHYVRKDAWKGTDGRVGVASLLTIFCALFSFASAREVQAQELRQVGATGFASSKLNAWAKHCAVLFVLLFAFLMPASLMAQGAKSTFQIPAGPVYNYSLYEAVRSEPIVSEKYYRQAIKRYPKADLHKYPMATYHVDPTKVPLVREGDLLPDELLDLPLWVVNDLYGRDTITLRSEMDKEWTVLYFWFSSCGPCIRAMQEWENLAETEGSRFNFVGVKASFYPHQAMPAARRFGFSSPQVIGLTNSILSTVFLHGNNPVGCAVWIKNGRLFGVSQPTALNVEEYKSILKGELDSMPDHAR